MNLALRRLYSWICWIAAILSGGHLAYSQHAPIVSVQENLQQVNLVDQLLIFEDSLQRFDINAVAFLPDDLFTRITDLRAQPSSTSNVWIKIYFSRNADTPGDWILSVGNRRSPDFVTGYSKKNEGYKVSFSGALCPLDKMAIKDRTGSKIPISIAANDTTVIFLKVSSITKRPLSFAIHLETAAYAIKQAVAWITFQAIVHGALLIMSLFGFLVYLIDRDKAYLFYGLYLVNLSLLLLGITGLASDVFGIDDPSNFIYFWQATQCLSSIFYFTFAKYFTNLNQNVPEAVKWITAVVWFNLALIPIQLIFLLVNYDYNSLNTFAGIKSFVDVILITYLSGKLLQTRKKINYYFVAGSAVLVISGFATVFLVMLFNVDSGSYAHEVGALLDLAIFSVGLGHRMKLNEREKRETQQKLIDQLKENQKLQENINRELEHLVKQRTKELIKQSEEILEQNNRLEQSNKEKAVLLSEMHHRVKNNLQIISSLLSIQSHSVDNEKAKIALWDGQSRVQAMGLIHENIYKTDNFARVNMQVYLSRLADVLVESMGRSAKPTVIVKAHNMNVGIDTAIPLGLITNELITNCLKHAFHNVEDPRIEIEVFVDSLNALCLNVRDNGLGGGGLKKSSFGLRLVEQLAAQMHGSITFEQKGGVTAFMRLHNFQLN